MNTSRPNLILIVTDQQRYDTIRALGASWMQTPALDRLAQNGVVLSQCHVTAASCAPSRASLFMGYFPHTTGVLKNADPWKHAWVELLSASGYRCVNIGKMHTFPYQTPLGFHERYVVENKDRYLEGRYFFDEWDKAMHANGLVKQQRELYRQRPDYAERLGAFEWELPERLHSDAFVGGLATWWIDSYPKTEPLFLQIGFPGPHPPYDPPRRFIDLYEHADIPIRLTTSADLAGQPLPFHKMRQHNHDVDHDSVIHLLNPTPEQLRRQRAYYLANVTLIDEWVQQIMDALQRQGYLENAVVIFTSDHGDCLGDHGHSQKWTMYDEILRVPTIIYSPVRFPGGRTVDGLCQHMDLGPTLLELAGLPVPESFEAQSLLPALEGKPWSGRPFLAAEQARDGILQHTEFMTMFRDRDWKLVHFLDEPFGQLFDLRSDPAEERNLWDDPAARSERTRLLDQLREWRIRSQYQTASWTAAWR